MDERTIQVDHDGEILEVTYDREALGQAYAETAQGFASGTSRGLWSAKRSAESHATVAALAAVLTSWDVTNEGEPWPPTLENLAHVPLHLLDSIHRAIDQDAFGPR
jgi:hypothetical protein